MRKSPSPNPSPDPWTTGSDFDGLSDAAEELDHGTNPRDPDTDRDGVTDAEEAAAGTDPLNADSHPDG